MTTSGNVFFFFVAVVGCPQRKAATFKIFHLLHKLLKIFTESFTAWPLANAMMKQRMMLGC